MEEEKLSSGGTSELGGEGKRKFGDGEEVELGGAEEGKKIGKQGHHLRRERGGVQSPETSIEEEEGFNFTQKPAGGK